MLLPVDIHLAVVVSTQSHITIVAEDSGGT